MRLTAHHRRRRPQRTPLRPARATRDGRKRRGFLSMELALTLPIFAIILFALFEFSLLLTARGQVVEAARTAARAATLPGADRDSIEAEVLNVLPRAMADDIQMHAELTDEPGEPVLVALRVPMNTVAPDLLWPIGYSLDGRYLQAQARMVRE